MGAKKTTKGKHNKMVASVTSDEDDAEDGPDKCLCGMNVHTGALFVGFIGMFLSSVGFLGSWYMKKVVESLIEGFSMLSYFLVFWGRLRNNRHWYLPLLIVHALAIPILTIVGILFILVNTRMLQASQLPFVIHLQFSLELTADGMILTAYNALTSLVNIYFINVVTRSYLFMRRVCPKRKKHMRIVKLV